ncbi:MAG: hypothetical protein CVV64_05915 [Candidatus Wallbacteria bacterium HGW-Wallbacteria-1]|uniref:Pesticidal crystal protein Cry22Aa Ig-like domain-containing protein n=1 Tax=Candidatus Wallbacteria bacterium HGW-Wallbacteria-1 TaxID=2013854 RepID=A0A2N1PSQ6_9BACT|nr:MAG: hypothetical protein CVV64_05915 [Candidatus Wallbacteria bacterium HGW-Wallbacteria-1]
MNTKLKIKLLTLSLLLFIPALTTESALCAEGSPFMQGKSFITSALGNASSIGTNQGWNINGPWEVRRTPDRMPTSEEFLAETIEGVAFPDWRATAKATWISLVEPKPLLVDYSGGVQDISGDYLPKNVWNSVTHPDRDNFNLILKKKLINSNFNQANPTEPKYIYQFINPADATAAPTYFVYRDVEYKWEFQKSPNFNEATIKLEYPWDYDIENVHSIKSADNPGAKNLVAEPWDPGVSHDGDTVRLEDAEKALFHVYMTLSYKRAKVIIGTSTETEATIASLDGGYEESAPGNPLWVGGNLEDPCTCTWGTPFPTYKDMFGGGGKSGVAVTYVEDYTPPELMVTVGEMGNLSMKNRVISGQDIQISAPDDNPNNPATSITFEYAISTKEVYYDDINGDGQAKIDDDADRFIYISMSSPGNPSARDGYFGDASPLATSVATTPKRMFLSAAEKQKVRNAKAGNGDIIWKEGSYWVSPPSMNTQITGESAAFSAEGIILPIHASSESGDGIETKKTSVTASNCCGNQTTTTTGSIKPHDDVRPNLALTIAPSAVQDFAHEPVDEKHDFGGAGDSGSDDIFSARDYFIPNGDTLPCGTEEIPGSNVPVPDASGKIVDATGNEYGRWTNDLEEWTPEKNFTGKDSRNMLEAYGKFCPPTKKRVKFIGHSVDNLDRWDGLYMRTFVKKQELDIQDESGNRPIGFEPVTLEPESPDANGASRMKPLVAYHIFRKPGTYTVVYTAEDTQGNKRVMKVKVPVTESSLTSQTIQSTN